jgi:1,4-alpha-glucan branching enzyme
VRLLVEEIACGEGTSEPSDRASHLYGVRQTTQGVLFVQPAAGARHVAVAGDFNRWSLTANPMRYNPQLDVYQAIVEMAPGTYRYRLVVDGRWLPDPYNPHQHRNEYGELSSVLTVAPSASQS